MKTVIDMKTRGCGVVEKPQTECLEIATVTFGGLAMTQKPVVSLCEERSDEAISTFSTPPLPIFFARIIFLFEKDLQICQ